MKQDVSGRGEYGPEDADDGFQIGAKICAVKCKKWLRGVTQGVRQSQTDAFVPDIEGECAGSSWFEVSGGTSTHEYRRL